MHAVVYIHACATCSCFVPDHCFSFQPPAWTSASNAEPNANALLHDVLHTVSHAKDPSLYTFCAPHAGNILDNHELIATLEKAKASAVDIAEKLQQAKLTSKEIDDVRVKYSGAARRGAVLFFVMAGLANVNKMYEYSLSSFLTVFSNTLATSKKDASLEARLKNVIEATTSDVYNYTCLGLFEKHKLMFSFQVHSLFLAIVMPCS